MAFSINIYLLLLFVGMKLYDSRSRSIFRVAGMIIFVFHICDIQQKLILATCPYHATMLHTRCKQWILYVENWWIKATITDRNVIINWVLGWFRINGNVIASFCWITFWYLSVGHELGLGFFSLDYGIRHSTSASFRLESGINIRILFRLPGSRKIEHVMTINTCISYVILPPLYNTSTTHVCAITYSI